MTEAQTTQYWISPYALHIQLNAMGNPDYIQANVASGAAILCYMKGVTGLGYDAGHNYQSWPLAIAPTVFNTPTEKYVYVAIPKPNTPGATSRIAQFVFPSQHIDLYGKAEPTFDENDNEIEGEQIGSTDYFYIFTRGILSASEDEHGVKQNREWIQHVETGTLSTDEALSTLDTDWYSYSTVSQVVTFLKDIAMSAASKFLNINLNGKTLTSVATDSTTLENSTEAVVTPAYLNNKYLRKDRDDTARGTITFLQGAIFGPESSIWGYVKEVVQDGVTIAQAWFRNLESNNFETAVAKVTNYLIGGSNGLTIRDDVKIQKENNADAQLQVATLKSTNIENSDTVKTHNLIVTGLAHFFELIVDKIRASGGAEIKSAAEGFKVEFVNDIDLPYPNDPNNERGELIPGKRLYFLAEDPSGRARIQSWKALDQAICMTFNAGTTVNVGVNYNVTNKYFWTLVQKVSDTPVPITIDGESVECHYIDIYAGEGTETSAQIPVDENNTKLWDGLPSAVAVGDEIAMLGYRGIDEPARQSAIYESAYSALDTELVAPLHAVYQGINDFNLSSHRKTFYDATRNTFIGEFYSSYISNGNKDIARELVDITSRSIIKGGSEKQRLRLLYDELRARKNRIDTDISSNSWNSNSDTYKDSGTIPHYNLSPTYANMYIAVGTIWLELHQILNSYVDGDGYLQFYDSSNDNYPLWINDDNIELDTDINAMVDAWKEYYEISDDDFNLSDEYESRWKGAYDVFQEAEFAIDVYTREIINEAAIDNVLSAKEKSMLRTTFANEVNRYFELVNELASFGNRAIYKRSPNQSTQVTIDDIRSAINALGTYFNANNPWKVEPMQGDASGTVYWYDSVNDEYVYPSYLTGSSLTASTVIEGDTYLSKWNDWFAARDEIIADMAAARQKIVNEISTDNAPPFYYVGNTNPLEDPQTSSRVKDGDHWYKPTTLTNPITGETISSVDGKPLYDRYVCKTIEGGLDWVLLDAATQAVMSITDMFYLAVFDSTNSSSIIQKVNQITQTVAGTGITGANMILNSDFEITSNGNPERFMKEGDVQWERSTEQAPTNFKHSLLISASASEGIRMQNSSQPHLTLEDEENYILSAFVRVVSSNNVTPILQVRRGLPTLGQPDSNVLEEFELEGNLWHRISLNITGDGVAEPIKFTLKTAGSFYITGLQLEKGNILTAWRKAEEDWQSQIDMNKEEIALRVTKNGLAQAGVIIDGNNSSVTLVGKKTSIQGDLDLQGLMTENVATFPFNYANPIVVNMGIFHDDTVANNVTVKSVQIQARNERLDGTNTSYPVLVALPFYDSAAWSEQSDNWASETNIGFDTDNTFSIFADASVPDSLKRIVKYTKSGTRITITNEADQYARNWQSLLTSNDSDSYKSQSAIKIRGNCAVVCADARLLDGDNYDDPDKELIPNEITQDDAGKAKWKGGMFSCGGYLARFIAVLPGQTLQLRSQIMTISATQEVLVWIVENPTEFVPMNNGLSVEGVGLYNNNMPTFSPTDAYGGINDCWMGHPVLNLIESNNPLDLALGRVGTGE